MITINLTPIEELENPYWWIPDVASLILVVVISLGGVFFYVDSVKNEIQEREAEKQRLIDENALLKADVEKFNSLNTKISNLESKKSALKRITESKLVRYLPIILLENIQNLKPDGVWLKSLAFLDQRPVATNPPVQANANNPAPPTDPAANPNLSSAAAQKDFPLTIEISGGALNNVLIAEFMMALKATQNQSFEKSDLRTQLFFSDVGIAFSQISSDQTDNGGLERPSTISFKLDLNFREREESKTENTNNFSQFIEDFKRDGQATMN